MPWGGDTHDIWIDPTDGNRILVTHDGGMYMTNDHGQTASRVTLPIGQMYHVAVDNDVPYHIYGNMQDDGTMRGPSNSPEVSAVCAQRWSGVRRIRRIRPRRLQHLGARAGRLRIRLHAARRDRSPISSGPPATATK